MSTLAYPAAAILAVVSLVLMALLLCRPTLISDRLGKALAALAFCALPLAVTGLGTASHLERSKSTDFCLSCHVMKPYGESLAVADPTYVAASHYQNNRIPRDQACYTCHTTYTMYGDLRAKLQGLKHLYVNYLGQVPETLELYQPYSNRECFSCHAGARAFEEDELHAEIREEMNSGDISCMDCHEPVHDVAGLDELEKWEGFHNG